MKRRPTLSVLKLVIKLRDAHRGPASPPLHRMLVRFPPKAMRRHRLHVARTQMGKSTLMGQNVLGHQPESDGTQGSDA